MKQSAPKWRRLSLSTIYPILDWFIPASIRKNKEMEQRARMFLVSHLIGPFLGHTITIYLYLLDPMPDFSLAILAASISLFATMPFLLKWTGWYTALAVLSVRIVFLHGRMPGLTGRQNVRRCGFRDVRQGTLE